MTLPPIDEKQWQQDVVKLARTLGWRVVHFRSGRAKSGKWTSGQSGPPGWPDLILLRPPRLVVAELKSETGLVTEQQIEWLALFRACRVEAYLWRPADLDEVVRILNFRIPLPPD